MTIQMKPVVLSLIAAALLPLTAKARAEGPAAGPSSQGGDTTEVAPTGVEKPLPPTRQQPDPSEGKPPTDPTDTPAELEGPKVKAEPK